jgi:hypothetical protein
MKQGTQSNQEESMDTYEIRLYRDGKSEPFRVVQLDGTGADAIARRNKEEAEWSKHYPVLASIVLLPDGTLTPVKALDLIKSVVSESELNHLRSFQAKVRDSEYVVYAKWHQDGSMIPIAKASSLSEAQEIQGFLTGHPFRGTSFQLRQVPESFEVVTVEKPDDLMSLPRNIRDV